MGKILITGADGFIGSHLTERLARSGRDIRAFVCYNSFGSRGWLDEVALDDLGVEVFAGDVRDPAAVREAVRGCEAVLHLAALIAIPYSYRAPDAYIETNVKGTLNVLQAARDFGIARIVHTSTSEVYGTAQFVPITEEHRLRAQSPYAASKIAADQLALSFHRSFGLPVTVLRPFNTYGPRQSVRAVIPAIILQLLAGAPALRLGSLAPTRDFNFVEDTAAAFQALLEAEGVEGKEFNAGSSHEISIGDLAALLAGIIGTHVEIVTDQQRLRPSESEVERLLADSSRLLAATNWRPVFAGPEGLRRGLAKTVEWFADTRNLTRYRPETHSL